MWRFTSVGFLVLVLIDVGPVFPQTMSERLSPHEFTSERLAGKTVQIEYGRPYRKRRKVIGGILRYGRMWRTGADEAPVLSTDGMLTIGTLTVPPGFYSLFTIPGKDHWILIINREPNLKGRYGYNRKKDLGRVEMDVGSTPDTVEQFTISIQKTATDSAILKLIWENTVASVHIMAN